MRPFRYGAQGLRWCLRRQAARDSRVSGGAVALKAPGLRMCACTFGRHHREHPSHSSPPALCARGRRAPRLRFINAAGGGPTLLPFLAPRRGTWSTSRCHTAAVEVVGWVMGPGLFSLGPGRRGRVGAPAKHAPPATHFWREARKSHKLRPLVVARVPGYGPLRLF